MLFYRGTIVLDRYIIIIIIIKKAMAMEVFKVRRIVLDEIGVDSIFLDPAVPAIFYFKHDVGASNVINFNKVYLQP